MKTVKLTFLAFSLCAIPFFSAAQTGAGGVGSAATNPVWYDANELNLTNGSNISNVSDMSGNGNDITQLNTVNQPVYTTGALNGLPVMTFDGTNDYLERGATSGLETGAITIFAVFQRTLGDDESIINGGYTGELDKWQLYDPGNNRVVAKHNSPQKFAFFTDATGNPLMVSCHFRGTGTQIYNSGTLSGTQSNAYSAETGHNLIRMGAYNYNLTAYFLQGFIAELFIFNTDLNTLERRIVENYLGNKYGFTIPVDRYAFESTHNIGIIGIGNNGFDSHSDSQGAGVLQVNNPTSNSSGDHMFIGHTNTGLDQFTTADLPASLPTHKRWSRTWRVDKTNDVGNVDLIFHLAGGNNFGASTSYRLLQDSDGIFTDATVHTGTYNAGAQTITFSGISLNDGDFITLAGIEQMLEIHSHNGGGDWSDVNTWDCNCVPTSNDEVYIDPATNVTVDIDGETGYFSVEPGGTLTMNVNQTLSINGEFDFAGTANLTDGTIAMVGTTDQYIDAGGGTLTFHNLTINNTGPSNIDFFQSTYVLNGLLTPTSGNLILENAATDFIINSTGATTGGRVGPVQSAATFSGFFTVRRSIAAGDADWRNIAPGVDNVKFVIWDPDLEISCDDCPDGCAYGNGDCFVSIKHYKNNTSIDMGSINDFMVPTNGYEVFCGDDLNTFSGTTLNTKGELVTGTQSPTVSGNWEIMGNPYACPFDFDNLDFSGVGQYFYVYDVTLGGYQWYDRVSGTSSTAELSEGYVAIGQGIWMNGPGTITLEEGDKVTTDDATFIRSQEKYSPSFWLTLKENNSTYQCVANVETSFDASNGADQMDVIHLEMPQQKAPSVAFKADDKLVRKTYVEKDFVDKVLPMYVNIINDGYYTFSTENSFNFEDYRHVYLTDAETGDIIDLKEVDSYVFYAQAGISEDRFTLVLSNQEIMETDHAVYTDILDDNNITITQLDHVIDVTIEEEEMNNVEITIVNVLGQVEMVLEVTDLVPGSNMITVPAEVKGVRILSINDNGNIITKKLVF